MAGDQRLQAHTERPRYAPCGVQAELSASCTAFDSAHAPRSEPALPLELPLAQAPILPQAFHSAGEVAGDGHAAMLPTGSAPVEMTGRAVQAKTSEAPAHPTAPPSWDRAGVSELSRTRSCQALLFVARRGDKRQQCGDAAHGERYRGVSLCWTHRKVVDSGRATLEQVLDGKRTAEKPDFSASGFIAAANRRNA